MKLREYRTWLLMTLAAALTATAAQAADNVTVYGKARMSVDSTDGGSHRVARVSGNSPRP